MDLNKVVRDNSAPVAAKFIYDCVMVASFELNLARMAELHREVANELLILILENYDECKDRFPNAEALVPTERFEGISYRTLMQEFDPAYGTALTNEGLAMVVNLTEIVSPGHPILHEIFRLWIGRQTEIKYNETALRNTLLRMLADSGAREKS
jgi:hypothetical protein